jgi:hypothetical protein
MNQRRLELLGTIEKASGRRRLALEAVLEAFMGPALRMAEYAPGGGPGFVCLLGRTFIEPDVQLHAFFMDLFKEVAARFIPAIQRAAPDIPAPDLFWRLHFMIGCLAQTMSDKERLVAISKGQVNPDDTDTATRQLVAFVAGGMRAPVVTWEKRRKR